MTTQKLDEPDGIDTEHWVKLQVCITAYSQDDNDPSGDDWESSLQLLYDVGKVKRPSLKQPSGNGKRVKEEARDPSIPTTKSSKPEKLPPIDNLLQIYLHNSMQYMRVQLQ